MKQRIDNPEGRARYGRRFATVEPVFGNLRYNKGLDRFTLRGQKKVDAQWKLFCLGAQHREAGASRVCAMMKEAKGARPLQRDKAQRRRKGGSLFGVRCSALLGT